MKRYRSDGFKADSVSNAEELAARKEATELVERWNGELDAKRTPQFSPTIRAAMRAGKPWLRLYCPGCRQVYQIDLRCIVTGGRRDSNLGICNGRRSRYAWKEKSLRAIHGNCLTSGLRVGDRTPDETTRPPSNAK
jgi:hypothetical protein